MKKNEKLENCELCGHLGTVEKHHLIPQRVCRSAKYSKELKNDESNFLWICPECHDQIHALYTEQELRDLYPTKEDLIQSEAFGKFLKWRMKHQDFKGSSKMSNRKRFS